VAERARVDEIRRQVVGARQEAITADAERLVPTLLAAPKEREQAAETALEDGDFAGARERLAQALEGYAAAAAGARRAAVTQAQETAAQRAQSEATAARQRAGVAAPRQAGPQWTKALRAQQQGETALGRKEYEQARAAFVEAEQGFREAEAAALEKTAAEERARQAQAAAEAERQRQEQQRREVEAREQAERQRLVALQRQQADAERARDAVTPARRAAEEAKAERHAPRIWAAARAKEQEAQVAVGRQEYERATELFRGAHGEYQAAAQEAQREVTRLALAEDVGRARVKVAADRDQAVKAEANVLAKDLFDRARVKETEGEGLYGRQELVAARQAYQEASQRYAESVSRAGVLRDARTRADAARTRMQSERAQARDGAPDFAAAVTQERQGAAQYQGLAFKEAAESFRAAADLFAKAVPPPEPPKPSPARSPREEIQEVLASYTQAHEKKDLALLRKVWPGLSNDDARKIRDTFDHSASIKCNLTIDSFADGGNVAHVTARQLYVVVAKDGKTHRNDSRVRFVLNRTHLGWHIWSVN
jgi:colicin import membrane protein